MKLHKSYILQLENCIEFFINKPNQTSRNLKSYMYKNWSTAQFKTKTSYNDLTIMAKRT